MWTSQVVSRLSSRLQPITLKFNNKPSAPLLVSVSSKRFSRSSRLPVQLTSVGSMMPLHSAIASSMLISSLSSEKSWAIVPQGIERWRGTTKTLSQALEVSRCRYDVFIVCNENGGELGVQGTPGDWSHIIKQIGMFTFNGLDSKQVAFVTREYHLYITSDGFHILEDDFLLPQK